jgi:hypothetical protein
VGGLIVANLSEYLDQYIPRHPGPNFDGQSLQRYTRRLQDLEKNVTGGTTFLAVTLWQILMETQAFADLYPTLGLRPVPWYERDARVVMHGDANPPEYDLLILDRTYTGTPRAARLTPSNDDLVTAFDRWQKGRRDNLNTLFREHRISKDAFNQSEILLEKVADDQFAIEAVHQAEFHVLAARMPDLTYTSLPGVPWRVVPRIGTGGFASAGAVVRSQGNTKVVGVTVPAHLLLPNGPANPVGWVVDVNGQSGTVVSCDMISDSCFVELRQVGPPNHVPKASQGLVPGGVAPGLGTVGYFEGAASQGKQSGKITSVSVNVFNQHPLVQQTFDLSWLTNPGDSGCALIDGNGHILGFALACTTPVSNPSFSTWVWANSVFGYHKLQAF